MRKGSKKRNFKRRDPGPRTNETIRAPELRVIGPEGENFGVLSRIEAQRRAEELELDLVEIAPSAKPPVAKIVEYGKFQYEQKKKASAHKAKAHTTEVKNVQVKLNTGEHDLKLKAAKADKWLREGHRIKLEIYLVGRAKYMEPEFLDGRLKRIFEFIETDYKIAQAPTRAPKGRSMIIEKA